MIDIRLLAQELAKNRSASDDAAFTRYAHIMLRNYGQTLLGTLADAITPATPEEIAIIDWLRNQIVAVAAQIPDPKE